MKKKLPIIMEQPLVSNVDYMHILSVALNNPKAQEWMAENYVQIIGGKNFETQPVFYNFIDYSTFFNTEYYFVAKNKACPFLDTYRHSYVECQEYGLTMIEYIKQKIDYDNYIFLFWDITKIPVYKFNVKHHCPVIYGYDDEVQVLYFIDYCDLHYGIHTVSYKEAEEAISSFLLQEKEYKPFIDYGINCMKLIDCDYEFNPYRLKKLLNDYLLGDDMKPAYMKFIDNDNYHYGIDVLNLTIESIEERLEQGNKDVEFLDVGFRVRYAHFVDHALLMRIRVKVLRDKEYLEESEFIRFDTMAEELEKAAKSMMNAYMKVWITKKVSGLSKLSEALKKLRDMQINFISELIKML